MILVDALKLNPGRTVTEAHQYFESISSILERHGFKRVVEPLEAKSLLRGSLDAQLINLFEVEDPKQSLGGMMEDPDYQTVIPMRDEIFDLENSSVLVTARSR